MLKTQPHQQYRIDPISTNDINDHPNNPDKLNHDTEIITTQHSTMASKSHL